MSVRPIVSRLIHASLFTLALCGAGASFALPLTDLGAEDLLPMTTEVKKTLKLSANQEILWNQVEAQSRSILRERQKRRQALQERAKELLGKPDVELRDLDREAESELTTAFAEDRKLRALWLEMNDALDDSQRRHVADLLSDQLMRVIPEGGRAGAQGAPRTDRPRRGSGMGRGAGPGAGGMGGPGGATINGG